MRTDLSCVILAGGLGTRLRSVLPNAPKPMASINGRPFLEYLIAQVRRAGITDIIICVGYRADAVREYFGDGSYYGVTIRYSQEQELLGTAGAVAFARGLIHSDPFVLMNGDSYCDVDFKNLLEQHWARQGVATMVASRVEDQSRYGSLILDSHDAVTAFVEKGEASRSGYINAGIYVLQQAIFDLIPQNQSFSIERDVFPILGGYGLYAFKTTGLFIDIGIPSELKRAQSVLRDHLGA